MKKINIPHLQKNILSWYKEHGRDLPWRKTTDPYQIHISEVMLQQTQVDRVAPYFLRWIEKLPDYKSLAKVSQKELLTLRSGLGFNSRALRLQQCAKTICEQYDGILPNTITRDELLKLPGIGNYTSSAILAFSFNQDIPVIDTNIRRVLIFLFGLDENISAEKLEKFAEKVLPRGQSRDRHNALMDGGALELTARRTKIKSLSKQSKFEGSERQVRGRIIKQLVKNTSLTLEKIASEFPQQDISKILSQMEKENLVKVKGKRVIIE